MSRCVVLFAREPGREARQKGFAGREGAALFSELAGAWKAAAAVVGARLEVSAPPEDVAGWRRRLSDTCRGQRGASFGERLENAARDAAAGSRGPVVLVGGDVPASAGCLEECFGALEGGAAAALAPAPDGGVSMLSLREPDLDLLRAIQPRRRVFAALHQALRARRRRVAVVRRLPDVDGRRSLSALCASLPLGTLRALARLALDRGRCPGRDASPAPSRHRPAFPALRAPPAA